MNKLVSSRLSDECLAIAGLLAPLLVPIGLIGIGQYVLLGLAQLRELLRNLLSEPGQGLHAGIFFLAYIVWILVCRELALKLLDRPEERTTSSPRLQKLTALSIRLVKLGVVTTAIYTAFSILKGEETWMLLWPLAQVVLVSAGIILAAFNFSTTRYSLEIPLLDVGLLVALTFAVFLVISLSGVTTLSWVTSQPSGPSLLGRSIPVWIPLLCALAGATLQGFASIASRPSYKWRAVSVGLLLVAISAVALPFEPAMLLALGLAGVFPSAMLFDSWPGNRPWPRSARGGWIFAIPALIGLATFGLLFTGYPAAAGKWLGSIAILFIGLAVWSAFVAAIWCAIIFRQRALGVTVGLIGAIMMSGSIDHRLRAELPKSGTQDQRPKIHDHYAAWKKNLPDPDTSPIFVVAASGGGLRAAYWTALLLTKLDDATCGQFSRHVYAYSGVSGGSLGVAAFEAQRATAPKHDTCEAWRAQQTQQFLGQDFLGSVIGSTLFAEPLQRLFFWHTGSDRGSVLADAWTAAWNESHEAAKGAFARPFLEVFDTKAATDQIGPAIFINATRVETGQRAVATNVQIPLPDVDDLFRVSALKRDTRLETHGLTVADTVLNSARFTYVSPAATVWGCFRSDSPTPTSDACSEDGVRHQLWGRLVDGGYFENSGLATLTEVVRELGISDRKLQGYTGNPVYFIVITNARESILACPGRMTPRWNLREPEGREIAVTYEIIMLMTRMVHGPAEPALLLPTLSEVSSPFEALLSVRAARANVEAEQLQLNMGCQNMLEWALFSQTDANGDPGKPIDPDPALGWFLSTESRAWMDMRADEYAEHFPFDMAFCDRPERRARGQIGDPAIHPQRCPEAALPQGQP
jgi:hypothetical protein